jgi:hypothetical protein
MCAFFGCRCWGDAPISKKGARAGSTEGKFLFGKINVAPD